MVRQHLSSKFGVLAGIVLVMAALVAACSATGGGSEFTASTGNGGGHSVGSHAGGGDPGAGTFVGSGNGGSGAGVGGGCAGTSSKAQLLPLDMYIMLDQSGSMGDAAGPTTKWQAVTSALKTFVSQPNLTGVSVGIQYFPVPVGGAMQCPADCSTPAAQMACGACGGICFPFPPLCVPAGGSDSCDFNDYAKAAIEIAPLPGIANAIINSINSHMPSGGTPTSASLQGAIKHASDWAKANPTHVSIVVYATDGDPSECDTSLPNINAIAAAGANSMPKILTFVIGVGPSLSAVDGIAAAGGTMTAFHVDTNANANQQFLDAMNKIRGSVLSCSYLIPAPPPGQMLDYGKVNVEYTPGAGGNPITIPKVASKASCPPSGLGWYYDNDAKPTQIILCDDTCKQITMDSKASVNVVLGCGTVIK